MAIKQLSVFVDNKQGALADITDLLAKASIDLRAMSIADTTDFGILRLIVDKPKEAVEALRQIVFDVVTDYYYTKLHFSWAFCDTS